MAKKHLVWKLMAAVSQTSNKLPVVSFGYPDRLWKQRGTGGYDIEQAKIELARRSRPMGFYVYPIEETFTKQETVEKILDLLTHYFPAEPGGLQPGLKENIAALIEEAQGPLRDELEQLTRRIASLETVVDKVALPATDE